jgi:hypothetical protein
MLRSTVQARGSLAIARRTASPLSSAPSPVACRNASYPCSKSSRSQNELPRGISMKKLWSVSSTALARLTYAGVTPGSGRTGWTSAPLSLRRRAPRFLPATDSNGSADTAASSHPWPTLHLARPAGTPATNDRNARLAATLRSRRPSNGSEHRQTAAPLSQCFSGAFAAFAAIRRSTEYRGRQGFEPATARPPVRASWCFSPTTARVYWA